MPSLLGLPDREVFKLKLLAPPASNDYVRMQVICE